MGHRRYTLLQQRNLIKTLQPMPRNVPHPYLSPIACASLAVGRILFG